MSEAEEDQPLDAIIKFQEGHPGDGMVEGITTGSVEDWTHAIAGIPAQYWQSRLSSLPKMQKGDKTVGNYLTACKMFTGQRGCMERHMRRAAKSVNILLTNPKAFLSLFQYIHDTRRFQGSTQSS